MNANFLDAEGDSKPVVMGSYGIGSGRLMASVVEEHNDGFGIIWPITIAPYTVHIIVLPKRKESQSEIQESDLDPLHFAEKLYKDLESAGIETLFDDRQESPGVKFNDADLIGVPIRLTVSERAFKAGGVEVKRRDQKEKFIIPSEDIIEQVRSMISDLLADLDKSVISIPFED
jgi:prolyl-tRNA synthetase